MKIYISTWFLIALLLCGARAIATGFYPPDRYSMLGVADRTKVDDAASVNEVYQVRSELSTRKIYSAIISANEFKTVTDEYDGGENWMFLLFLNRDLTTTQDTFNGTLTDIDTTQVPDINDSVYGSTISMLDVRHQQVYAVVKLMVRANDQVQQYIRNVLCADKLKASATTSDKRAALQTLGATQYDIPKVRAMITPLLTDPNGWVQEAAQKALDDLILRSHPATLSMWD